MAEATRLRETVRERKAHDQVAAPAAEEAQAEAPVLFVMDGRRLVTLGFYSFSLVIFAVLIGATQQFDFLLSFNPWDVEKWLVVAANGREAAGQVDLAVQFFTGLVALIGLIVIGFATGIGRTVLRDYGFRLERTAKGFRRRRGLLTKTDVTLPVERIQAASIDTGPLRQRRGWYALHFVSLANESKAEKDHMMAPLAKLDELWPILREARLNPPGKAAQFVQARPGPWIDEGLITAGALTLAAGVASRFVGPAAWAIPLLILPFAAYSWFDWRNRYHAVDGDQLYVRQGWWNRRLELARQVNVQSVSLTQGPLLRLRGLARIEFGIAGGTLGISGVSLADAKAIRDQVMAVAAPVDFSKLGLTAD
jgi:putative membrane protein